MSDKLVITQKSILLVAGAILVLIAGSIIAAPVEFYAANDIAIGADASLLNELKAPAGLLLASGVFMLAAVFLRRLADSATLLGAMIYLSYAAARGGSIWSDGMPAPGLVQAAALEGLVGLACLAVAVYGRLPPRRHA